MEVLQRTFNLLKTSVFISVNLFTDANKDFYIFFPSFLVMNLTVFSFLGQQDSEVLEYVLLEKVDQLGQGCHNQQSLSRFSLLYSSF